MQRCTEFQLNALIWLNCMVTAIFTATLWFTKTVQSPVYQKGDRGESPCRRPWSYFWAPLRAQCIQNKSCNILSWTSVTRLCYGCFFSSLYAPAPVMVSYCKLFHYPPPAPHVQVLSAQTSTHPPRIHIIPSWMLTWCLSASQELSYFLWLCREETDCWCFGWIINS